MILKFTNKINYLIYYVFNTNSSLTKPTFPTTTKLNKK